MEVEITLDYDSPRVAEAIAKAVSPDNLKTPGGLSIETAKRANRVITKLEYDGRFSTFIATIDDLLFCVSTAEKVLCAARDLGGRT